jgi:predicted amino acid-binding ACT domain protein
VQAHDATGRIHKTTGSVVDGKPRIVGIDEWRGITTFKPERTVLVLNNTDKPGAIAGVTSVLADAGINVASMGVARQGIHLPALCIVTVDSRIPKAVKSHIEGLEHITAVRTATFGSFKTV